MSVKRAHPLGKVLFQKNPRTSRLGAGQLAEFGAATYFLLVHVQEGGGFIVLLWVDDDDASVTAADIIMFWCCCVFVCLV